MNKILVDLGGFPRKERKWSRGDVISLEMPLVTKFIEVHIRIEEVRNQVATKRGPMGYCPESPDLPKETNITDAYIPVSTGVRSKFQGVFAKTETEMMICRNNMENMYNVASNPMLEPFKTYLIPYYAWSNRGQGEMTVFVPVIWN